MKIQIHKDGIVNIDTVNFNYANIRNMYSENRNGAGMQLSPSLESSREIIGEICDKIAALIYQLTDLESPHNACQALKPDEQNAV
jgi:hypothetical protein